MVGLYNTLKAIYQMSYDTLELRSLLYPSFLSKLATQWKELQHKIHS